MSAPILSTHLIHDALLVCYGATMLLSRQRRKRLPGKTRHADAAPPLENVLSSLSDPVILTDNTDNITLFNQAAEELTGVPRAHALLRPCDEVFKSTPPIVAMVQRTRTSGQSQSCGEETLVIARRRIPVRLSCSPIWGPNDEVQGTALVMQDLSYQKKLEDEARRSETLARLGGLVAGLAHEIKNPLGGIKGAAQLLAQRFNDRPEVDEYTGVMIREIDRLTRLVEQLLTLGTPPALAQQSLNVHKVIHEVLALMQSELSAKRLVVRLQIDPSLPEVRGDEAQLTHVFLNLVKNAMEAMPENGTLTITTRMETGFHILWRAARGGAAGLGKFLRVEFEDTGPGFPDTDIDRVFEPFFSTKPRGTGLGLAICQRIMATHGGDIRVENRRAGGARVTVTLPLVGA